jgi:hypothetical protein
MKMNMMFGAMVVAAVVATGARAQSSAAGNEASAAPAPQEQSQPQAQQPQAYVPYGAYAPGDATVDADGVPVAKPNPMSEFEDRNKAFDNSPMPEPLVDDPRSDNASSSDQGK